MREQLAKALEKEGQTIFLQWVRAIMALAVIAVACWSQVMEVEAIGAKEGL